MNWLREILFRKPRPPFSPPAPPPRNGRRQWRTQRTRPLSTHPSSSSPFRWAIGRLLQGPRRIRMQSRRMMKDLMKGPRRLTMARGAPHLRSRSRQSGTRRSPRKTRRQRLVMRKKNRKTKTKKIIKDNLIGWHARCTCMHRPVALCWHLSRRTHFNRDRGRLGCAVPTQHL